MRPKKVTVTLTDSDDREVRVTASYTPPTRDYYDRSWGAYMPGDPEEVDVLEVVAADPGANVTEVELDEERIAEAVRLAASDYDGPDCREE